MSFFGHFCESFHRESDDDAEKQVNYESDSCKNEVVLECVAPEGEGEKVVVWDFHFRF